MFGLVVFLLFIVIVTSTNGIQFNSEKENKEILFKYTATFNTIISSSRRYGSNFFLKANLHGQFYPEKKLRIFYLSDVLISLNNGELSSSDSPLNPLPAEHIAITYPFSINITRGQIATQSTVNKITNLEPTWIINVKKSIASLFDFDWEIFEENKNKTDVYTIEREENTLYGKCLVTYITRPSRELHKWITTKRFDPMSCSLMRYQNDFSNWKGHDCHDRNDAFRESDTNAENIREYEIIGDKVNVINKIKSEGKISFTPFNNDEHNKYTSVKQVIEFVEFLEVPKMNYRFENPLDMVFPLNTLSEKDILSAISLPEILQEHENCTGEVLQLMKYTSDTISYKKLIRRLSYYNLNDFTRCSKDITTANNDVRIVEQMLEIYYKIIPVIGTHESIKFIKQIVKQTNILPSHIITILATFPFHVLVPTESLLRDTFEFASMNFGGSSEIRHVAILSYAILTYRTYNGNEHKESKLLTRIVNIYLTNLKKAKNSVEQQFWLQGLLNIQLGGVRKIVMQLINREQILDVKYDSFFRSQAILAAEMYIKDHKEEVQNAIWPIIINEKANFEMRLSAIKVYLNGCQTEKDFNRIVWFMETETNPNIYNYFHSILTSIAAYKFKCNSNHANIARSSLKSMKIFGTSSSSYVESFEHLNSDGFGGKVIYEGMNNFTHQVSQGVHLKMYAFGKSINFLSIYSNYDSFLTVIKLNNKAILIRNYKRIVSLIDDFLSLTNGNNFLGIIDIFNGHKIIVNDMGFPVSINARMSTITSITYDTGRDNPSENGFQCTINFKQSLMGEYGINLINPIGQVTHKSMKEIRSDVIVAVEFNVAKIAKDFTFSMNLHKNGKKNHIKINHNIRNVIQMIHSDSNITTNLYYPIKGNKILANLTMPLKEFGVDLNVHIPTCSDSSKRDRLSDFKISDIFSCNYDIALLPSRTYPITKVELSIRPGKEEATEKRISITSNPKLLFVTPDEQMTRTWTIGFKFEGNLDFSSINLNLEIARTVKGEPIKNICVELKREEKSTTIVNEIKWSEGISFERECKDDILIHIDWEARHSSEQLKEISEENNYKQCESNSDTNIVSYPCVKAHTTLREYDGTIRYKGTPTKYKSVFVTIWGWIVGAYNPAIQFDSSADLQLKENIVKIIAVNPVHSDSKINVKVTMPEFRYIFMDIDYPFFILPLENLFVNKFDFFFDYSHKYPACVIRLNTENSILEDFHEEVSLASITSNEWITLTATNSFNENQVKIDVKKVHSPKVVVLNLRIVINNNTLIVRPDDIHLDKFNYEMNENIFNWMAPTTETSIQLKLFTIKDKFTLVYRDRDSMYFYVIFNRHFIETTRLMGGRGEICRYRELY